MFKDEQRALMMVYWQLKELRWNGTSITREARANLEDIRVTKLRMTIHKIHDNN